MMSLGGGGVYRLVLESVIECHVVYDRMGRELYLSERF